MRSVLFWVPMQRVVVNSYRPSGHPVAPVLSPWGSLMMGPKCCPEMSLRNYHYSLRKNPEERISHQLRGGSFKSCIHVP